LYELNLNKKHYKLTNFTNELHTLFINSYRLNKSVALFA
jgi:hypothetical protein